MKNYSKDETGLNEEQIDTQPTIDIEEACLIQRLDDYHLDELDEKRVFTDGIRNLFQEEK